MKNAFRVLCLVFFAACLMASAASAENYLLNGGQASRINYQMIQEVKPQPTTRKLVLSYVIPQSFSSPTYNQKITDAQVLFTPEPSEKKEFTDARGNKVLKATWNGTLSPVNTIVRMTAENSVRLAPLDTSEPFPLTGLPADLGPYLAASPMANTGEPGISKKAKELTASSKTEFDAVQKIFSWVVDNMHYTLNPDSFDATYSFATGRGNCQNYAHLSAALLRSVGIPVRVVTGVTLQKPYLVTVDDSILTMNMAEGRHAWIEVYFPDLGWMPFDPQNSALFVSNRFIRVEVGVDNEEAVQDGLVLWSQVAGTSGQPAYTEAFNTGFLADDVNLKGKKTGYGPKALLLYPEVATAFGKVPAAGEARPVVTAAIKPVDQAELKKLSFNKPLTFGNLEFPENVNFADTPRKAVQGTGGTMEMRKSFLVETAEYVTESGRQYAQAFVLDRPLLLKTAASALFVFGGEGQVWMEIHEDKDGEPGRIISTSKAMDVSRMKPAQGYTWVDFDFSQAPNLLSPGSYWVALGFSGTPIINWFYTYGKPSGPEKGTRYRSLLEDKWPNVLAHEFNFRVSGLASD